MMEGGTSVAVDIPVAAPDAKRQAYVHSLGEAHTD